MRILVRLIWKCVFTQHWRMIFLSVKIVGGVIKKQLQPIKDDLEYIKRQVDTIRDRIDGLTARIEEIEKALQKA